VGFKEYSLIAFAFSISWFQLPVVGFKAIKLALKYIQNNEFQLPVVGFKGSFQSILGCRATKVSASSSGI